MAHSQGNQAMDLDAKNPTVLAVLGWATFRCQPGSEEARARAEIRAMARFRRSEPGEPQEAPDPESSRKFLAFLFRREAPS